MMRLLVLVICAFFGMTAVVFPQTVEQCGAGIGLAWNANTEPDIQEYKVYATPQATQDYVVVAIVAHDPAKIITKLDGSQTIEGGMARVADGLTEFLVTAVDTSGNESSPSEHLVCNVQLPPLPPTGLTITIQLGNP